jgi:hypothetical protein
MGVKSGGRSPRGAVDSPCPGSPFGSPSAVSLTRSLPLVSPCGQTAPGLSISALPSGFGSVRLSSCGAVRHSRPASRDPHKPHRLCGIAAVRTLGLHHLTPRHARKVHCSANIPRENPVGVVDPFSGIARNCRVWRNPPHSVVVGAAKGVSPRCSATAFASRAATHPKVLHSFLARFGRKKPRMH